MKVGCLEVTLILNRETVDEDACKECIFKNSRCPNDCTGTTHYEMSGYFIDAQMSKYLKQQKKQQIKRL